MGDGNFQDYGMRMYNPRIGRFPNVDPLTKKYPQLTPYQFASNSPIAMIDIDGLEGSVGISGSANVISIGTPIVEFDHDRDLKPDYDEGFYASLIGTLGAGVFIGGSALTAPVLQTTYASITNWYIYSSFSNTLSGGLTYSGIFNTSLSFGVASGGSNLLGQFATNGFKLDEKINWSQTFFAATIKAPLTSNVLQSGISFDTKNGWDFDFASQDFFASFSSNLIADKFNGGLNKFNFSGNSKASNFMFNFYSGIATEIGGNLIEGQLQANDEPKTTKKIYPWNPENKNKENKKTGDFLSKFKKEKKNKK